LSTAFFKEVTPHSFFPLRQGKLAQIPESKSGPSSSRQSAPRLGLILREGKRDDSENRRRKSIDVRFVVDAANGDSLWARQFAGLREIAWRFTGGVGICTH
jgi:hypothetical protein